MKAAPDYTMTNNTDAVRLARVRAIINARWLPTDAVTAVCMVAGCSHCDTVKAEPFACAACGYVGQPHTFACECWRSVNQRVAADAFILAKYPTEESWPKDWKTTRTKAERGAARLVAWLETHTVGVCQGMGRGQPKSLTKLVTIDGECFHGLTMCPGCGAYGDGGRTSDTEALAYLLPMLRKLRAALTE